LQPRVTELLSERGSVSVDERTNMMIVRDIEENLDAVEELIRSLDTQTPQVLIEARIVEATSQYSRDVGIQWGGDVSMSSSTGNPTGLVFPSNVGVVGGATDAADAHGGSLALLQHRGRNPNYAVNLPAAVGTGAGWCARHHAGQRGRQLQPQRAPQRRRGARHGPHHQLAAHPDPRQPRGAPSRRAPSSRTRRSARRA
jgi:hypothetical protein